MSRRRSWRAAAVLAAVLTVATTAPAVADEAAPVVTDDAVTVWPGGSTQIDVLANDTDPGGDDLAVCRLPKPDPDQQIRVIDGSLFSSDSDPGLLQVSADPRARGTYEISYYVCNHARLAPATLTVHVRPVEPVDVVPAPSRPGWLRVTNHNDRRVYVMVTDPHGCRIDSQRFVRAGGARLLRVRHHHIRWTAFILGHGDFGGGGIAGSGSLRGVALDGPAAPLSKPGHVCGYGFGRGAGDQSAG